MRTANDDAAADAQMISIVNLSFSFPTEFHNEIAQKPYEELHVRDKLSFALPALKYACIVNPSMVQIQLSDSFRRKFF